RGGPNRDLHNIGVTRGGVHRARAPTVENSIRPHARDCSDGGAARAPNRHMQSKVKLLGHGVHPMLIVFPLGLLGVAPAFDAVHLATHRPLWAEIAFWMITCGLVGGLLAAVPGFIDWLGIPARTRARRVGLTHMLVNVSALALFGVSWVARVR